MSFTVCSYLFHADDVTLLDSTAHAVISFGYVHRASVVPAGTHTPVAVRIPPENQRIFLLNIVHGTYTARLREVGSTRGMWKLKY